VGHRRLRPQRAGFALIGLQLRPILERLASEQRMEYLAVRGRRAGDRDRGARRLGHELQQRDAVKIHWFGFHPPRPMLAPTARGGFLVAWSGMRGIVTLAAALALPMAIRTRFLIAT